MDRFEIHSHTMYSNIRLLDCINKPKELIDRAVELGLKGICITDHECLSGHVTVNKYAETLPEDFKVGLGNEIYLCKDREKDQKYYHFILIAKNKLGHKALRELSSRAWLNAYWDRGIERVVTTYDDLREIISKYPNTLIASTACLAGEVSSQTLQLINSEQEQNEEEAAAAYSDIINFITFCKDLFHDDFYIECAPGCSKEQILVNNRLQNIARYFNLKVVIGSDSHYLKKEDRYIHKAYLNSQSGEREVDNFYEYAYLQDNDEIIEHLTKSNIPIPAIKEMFDNSMEIYDKIEKYSLFHKQVIPQVEVKDYPKKDKKELNKYPILQSLFNSDDKIERYWVNQCFEGLEQKVGKIEDNPEYLDRLEEEADTKRVIGEKLETNMFSYPVTLQHYVDLIWDCGSIIGCGRGSACAGLNHYALGINQLNPVKEKFPWFRYMNKDRQEIGDIDIDICPSKRPAIIKAIKKERGQNFRKDIDSLSRENLGCTLVATFGTEGTRSCILSSCRGYRSADCPNGIDVDVARYLASLVPAERGAQWSLYDMVYGDADKGRKPIADFIRTVKEYDGLLDIMFGIEGLVNKRSSHASGVIFFDEDPYEFGCFMRTTLPGEATADSRAGEVITQYDLHDAEYCGMTKFDILVTDVMDKIVESIKLLQENGEIDKNLTIRQAYEKYLHPNVLPLDDKKYWEALQSGHILSLFQLDSDVGSQAVKKIKPNNISELTDANGLLRLLPEDGKELPLEKYVRYKNNIKLWYNEMRQAGLTEQEQKTLEPYFLSSYGVPSSQESLMLMLMDKDICGFSLAEANEARKIVAKKQLTKVAVLKEKVILRAKRKELGEYVWQYGAGPQMGYSFSIV